MENESRLSPRFERLLDRHERVNRAWLMVDGILEVYSTTNPTAAFKRAWRWITGTTSSLGGLSQ